MKPMSCQEALRLWRDALAGRPEDKARLNTALEHMGQCRGACVESLSAALAESPRYLVRPTGRPDLHEASGLRYEEAGDEHLRRLRELEKQPAASPEEVAHEREMADELWQSAEDHYRAGRKIAETM